MLSRFVATLKRYLCLRCYGCICALDVVCRLSTFSYVLGSRFWPWRQVTEIGQMKLGIIMGKEMLRVDQCISHFVLGLSVLTIVALVVEIS